MITAVFIFTNCGVRRTSLCKNEIAAKELALHFESAAQTAMERIKMGSMFMNSISCMENINMIY
jgi:hypothetical protein